MDHDQSTKPFYSEADRMKLFKKIESVEAQFLGARDVSLMLLYDLLALQINELQRLNGTMESIQKLILQGQQNQ